MTKRVIVPGTRTFENYELMCEVLDKVLPTLGDDIEIVSGHAEGADKLGERYAKEHNIKCAVFPADWRSHGRKAGPIRNSQMIKYASEKDPYVIAFWDGMSHGTLDTLVKAERKAIGVLTIIYDGNQEISRIVEYNYIDKL